MFGCSPRKSAGPWHSTNAWGAETGHLNALPVSLVCSLSKTFQLYSTTINFLPVRAVHKWQNRSQSTYFKLQHIHSLLVQLKRHRAACTHPSYTAIMEGFCTSPLCTPSCKKQKERTCPYRFLGVGFSLLSSTERIASDRECGMLSTGDLHLSYYVHCFSYFRLTITFKLDRFHLHTPWWGLRLGPH